MKAKLLFIDGCDIKDIKIYAEYFSLLVTNNWILYIVTIGDHIF